jgi:hypothetical protein
LASIANHIDKTNHAIEANVKTIPVNFTRVKTIKIYINNAIHAINQDTLYIIIKNIIININQIIHACIIIFKESNQILASIDLSDVR